MFPDSDIRVAVAARDSTHHRRSIALQYGCSKKPPGPKTGGFLFPVICRYFLVGDAGLEPATSAV